MQKIEEFVVKHRKIILIISIILLIPSIIGYKATRINYDILTYLPGDIKTIQGQNILSEDFDMGAYSIVVLKNMPAKDILKLENKIKKEIDNVQLCASIADVTGEEFPIEMLPDEVINRVYKNEETLLLVTFTDAISSDETMLSMKQSSGVAFAIFLSIAFNSEYVVNVPMAPYTRFAFLTEIATPPFMSVFGKITVASGSYFKIL